MPIVIKSSIESIAALTSGSDLEHFVPIAVSKSDRLYVAMLVRFLTSARIRETENYFTFPRDVLRKFYLSESSRFQTPYRFRCTVVYCIGCQTVTPQVSTNWVTSCCSACKADYVPALAVTQLAAQLQYTLTLHCPEIKSLIDQELSRYVKQPL